MERRQRASAEDRQTADNCTEAILDAIARRERLAPGEALSTPLAPDVMFTLEQLDEFSKLSPDQIWDRCILILRVARQVRFEGDM